MTDKTDSVNPDSDVEMTKAVSDDFSNRCISARVVPFTVC